MNHHNSSPNITVTRTFLEMREKTVEFLPLAESFNLQLVSPCRPSFYRYLYTEVGKDYHWSDRLIWSETQTQQHLNQPEISIWVLFSGGNPAGFFELKQYSGSQSGEVWEIVGAQGFAPSICTAAEQELLYQVNESNQSADNFDNLDRSVEIAYLGLMPEFIGQGLGKYLLSQAIAKAWELQPQRIWLHTCSLDHPHALANYLDRGFQVFKEDSFLDRRRDLTPKVIGLGIATKKGEQLISVPEIEVRAGQGIVGDRYFSSTPHAPRKRGGEITLIDAEALTALAADYQIHLEHLATRRNVLTQNIPLNHLVGHKFNLGDITLEGWELCEPCGHLEKLTQKGVRKGLIHRGGLRAKILSSGVLKVGDRFSVA
jgi:MOSC domain-containing protein YiiM/ribosomal protein S18 acetylase RimI-like enzyme